MTEKKETSDMAENASEWKTLVALFEKISALPDYQRKTQLQSLEVSDSLRAGLERMLGTLDSTVSWVEMPLSSRIQLDSKWDADKWVGKELDSYVLNELLHEGVVSAVFRATESLPVEREVVIKLVRPDAPKQYLKFFQFEQKALAKHAHPNIVTIHNVGASRDGVTYIVMEFIEGMPLSEYCDSNKLTVVERITLFLSICEAVTYSHQKGILHRDLKPSNVLVRNFEGKHSPTIIDYGISSELDEILDRPQGQLLGTPEYMSPEHVLDPNDLDSRADIYSLGMVLFNLLVGKIPFDRATIKKGNPEEIVSNISSFRVLSPTSFFNALNAEDQSNVAALRGFNASSFKRQLGSELDSIFCKATQKDRQQRYQSVAELSADIRRCLANEVVVAHPSSAWYRSRKFLSRNLVASMAVFIVAGLATAFMVKLIDQNSRIREEISQTQIQKQNAEQVALILAETIQFANPSNNSSTGKASVDGMLAFGYRNLENTLGISPQVKAELMLAFSSGFRGVGDISKAKEIHKAMLDNPSIDDPKIIAQTYLTMSQTARSEADPKAQIEYAQNAYNSAVENKLGGKVLATSMLALAKGHIASGEWAAASGDLNEALSIYETRSLDDERFLAEIIFVSGKVAYWRDQYEEAGEMYRQAKNIASRYYNEEHPRVIQIELAEIGLANHLQKYEESIPRSEELYKKAVKLWGPESHNAFAILTELTISYMKNERYDKAAQAARKNLLVLQAIEETPGERTVFTLTLLSNIYFYDEKYRKSFDSSIAAYELVKQPNEEEGPKFSMWRTAETELVHARSLSITGDLHAALSAYSSGVKVFNDDQFRSNDFLSSALTERAMVYAQLNSHAEAHTDASEGVEIAKLAYPADDDRIGIANVVKLYTGLLLNWSDEQFVELKQAWNEHLSDSIVANTPQFKTIGAFIETRP